MNSKAAVVIYSGGMDSYTLLHFCIRAYGANDIVALSVDYSQRHRKELLYATRACQELGVEHVVFPMPSMGPLLSNSALTGTGTIAVPEGHYEEESMKQTVVPNRNMILLSLGIGLAVNVGARTLYYGAHAGDHAIYPDCRPEFLEAMRNVAGIANYEPVEIRAPFMAYTKGQIANVGKAWGLDYGKAWTCYNGGELACGKCGACQERIEAMGLSGATDTMEYE